LSLANNRRVLDRHGNFCRFTLLNSQSCRADPPPSNGPGPPAGKPRSTAQAAALKQSKRQARTSFADHIPGQPPRGPMIKYL
jgi:hypothetical protein